MEGTQIQRGAVMRGVLWPTPILPPPYSSPKVTLGQP
jgi:hypothetical protein